LRDDLRLLVMSATLDQLSVASLMGNAPVIESEGRMFPVETVYEQFLQEGLIERKVCETVKRALSDCTGDILAFLPEGVKFGAPWRCSGTPLLRRRSSSMRYMVMLHPGISRRHCFQTVREGGRSFSALVSRKQALLSMAYVW